VVLFVGAARIARCRLGCARVWSCPDSSGRASVDRRIDAQEIPQAGEAHAVLLHGQTAAWAPVNAAVVDVGLLAAAGPESVGEGQAVWELRGVVGGLDAPRDALEPAAQGVEQGALPRLGARHVCEEVEDDIALTVVHGEDVPGGIGVGEGHDGPLEGLRTRPEAAASCSRGHHA
jgi:hypothetical protein